MTCFWHRTRPAVATLRYRDRVRSLCASCDAQISRILHALDAQMLDTLIEQCREEVQGFLEAADEVVQQEGSAE